MVAGEGFVVEGDRLVGRGLDTFAGEGFEKGEILGGVVLVRARFDCVYPLPFVCVTGIFVHLVVERVCVCGLVGEQERRASSWQTIGLAVSERFGIMLEMWPRGMYFLEASRRMRRNNFSAVAQKEGSSS